MAGVAAVVGFVTYTVVASMTAPVAPVQYYVPVATTARPTVAPMYAGGEKVFGAPSHATVACCASGAETPTCRR